MNFLAEKLKHLAPFTDAQLADLLRDVAFKKLEKGAQIKAESTLYLKSGLLAIIAKQESGALVVKGFLTEGQFATTEDFYSSEHPTGYVIEAIEASNYYSISNAAVLGLMASGGVWDRMAAQLFRLALMDKVKHEEILLTRGLSARLSLFQQLYPDLIGRVPGFILASYLAVTPEALSRARPKKR